MKALGVYLTAVREGRGLKSAIVAKIIGSSPTHLWRIEHGTFRSIGAELLHRLVQAIGASLVDVEHLLLSDQSSEDEARVLAERLLQAVPPSSLSTIDTQALDVEGRTLLHLATHMSPEQRARWMRIGEVLLAEQQDDQSQE